MDAERHIQVPQEFVEVVICVDRFESVLRSREVEGRIRLREEPVEGRLHIDNLGIGSGQAVRAAGERDVLQCYALPLRVELRRVGVVTVGVTRRAVDHASCRERIGIENHSRAGGVLSLIAPLQDRAGAGIDDHFIGAALA